ncbi:MAG: MBL fold metallo-hydrolase [Desulfurococcales archaeon]|nr:MBL fold metallo-hydrolase [Desulfurococcales archaeon]
MPGVNRPEITVLDVTPSMWGDELIASYLITAGEGGRILVETGPKGSVDRLLSQLDAMGVDSIDAIIVTHIHLDHAGAAGYLARKYNAKVYVHPRGAKHLASPGRLWSASRQVLGEVAEVYGEPDPIPEEFLVPVGDGQRLSLGGATIRVVHTPGHASHHMSLLLEEHGILFTGDSAGVSIVWEGHRIRIPTTPPPFRLEMYLSSIDKMLSLSPSRVAPTHYGFDPKPAVEYLVEHKRMVERWVRELEAIVGTGITDPVEAARALAERLEEAGLIAGFENPIVYRTFYLSTVWGMLDYIINKK